ncbi:MAG: hypothetical protein QNJ38_17100 [Prochloraceae cyanobacterium]|nr:hypothetical protein [Prochloraceae cyanobacterium]
MSDPQSRSWQKEADILGKPRPLWQVILFSGASLLLYYSYYKWVIHDELRKYNGYGWSGAMCMLPFLLGVALPQALWILDPDVGAWFGWFSLSGIVWIFISQFKLYCTINRMYREVGLKEPLIVWWMFVPGLNLIVGFRQIHFLSQYWVRKQNLELKDPLA